MNNLHEDQNDISNYLTPTSQDENLWDQVLPIDLLELIAAPLEHEDLSEFLDFPCDSLFEPKSYDEKHGV